MRLDSMGVKNARIKRTIIKVIHRWMRKSNIIKKKLLVDYEVLETSLFKEILLIATAPKRSLCSVYT